MFRVGDVDVDVGVDVDVQLKLGAQKFLGICCTPSAG